MMDSKMIFQRLKAKNPSDQPYEVFAVDESCYFGKDKDNNVVFMMPQMKMISIDRYLLEEAIRGIE